MKKKIILLALSLILILMIPAGLIGLMASETGSRWILQTILASLPSQVTIEKIDGRMLNRLSLSGIRCQTENETVTIQKLDFVWQASKLFVNTLKIIDFKADDLVIKILKRQEQPEKEGSNFIEDLNLPLKLDIDNLLLTNVRLQSGGAIQHLDKLQLRAATENEQFKLLQFAIVSRLITAEARGYVTLVKDLPLNFDLNWQVNADENGLWQGKTLISGKLNQLIIDNHITKPFSLAMTGSIADLLKTPRFNIQANWQNLNWPFSNKPAQIQSPQGRLSLIGPLNDYRLEINSKLNQQMLQQTNFSLTGNGSMDGFMLNKLELKSGAGFFQLSGQVSWKDIPEFDLAASGRNFNPGILVPELPGNLTFHGNVKGKLDPKTPQMAAEIDEMSGQLRAQPFNASGKFNLNGDKLTIDGLQLVSGRNKLLIEGNLDKKQGGLKWDINMPQLRALWPDFAGNLTGSGQLKGGWGNPAIASNMQGKDLRFLSHHANNVEITVDVSPDENINSKIILSATGIQSEGVQITNLSVDGSGSLKRHGFKTNIQSPQANLTSVLTGSLSDKQWRGEIASLDIKELDGQIWSLNQNTKLLVTRKPDGIEVALSESCLSQQPAALCVKGTFPAHGDLNFNLTARALPARIINPFLPDNIAIDTMIDGDMALQSKNRLLNGHYRFNTSPVQIMLKTKDGNKNLDMGKSDISGTVNGEQITANLNLNLNTRDFIRSRLQADTGKAQTLSGQISAAISDFAMLQAFAPQTSNVKGLLSADLAVRGIITKPVIKGTIDLTGGNADVGQIGLRQFNLHALALGGPGNPIQINGSAIPLFLNKPDAEKKIELKTLVNYAAEIQQGGELAGNFRLSLAPDTTIKLQDNNNDKQIRLGPSSMSGIIKGEMVFADLDIVLPAQDYLRGKLAANTGPAQTLSGQINAVIQNLRWVELLAPELSLVKGNLKADITMSGTIQKPQINGGINLNKGEVEIAQLGITVQELNLQAMTQASNSDQILLRGSAKSGQGIIKLDGLAGLQPDQHWPLRLKLSGTDFEVAKLPEAEIAISPDLQFQSTAQHKKFTGELIIPKAILKIQDLPENVVKVSEDEIILGEHESEAEPLKKTDIEMDIEVKLGKQVSFNGQGLQTNLGGKLKVINASGKMAMQGNIDMMKAKYKRFGQDLTVRKGKFVFNGPADNPWLDVEAIRVSKNKKVTAILSLNGTLNNPQTRIYSEPSLPESEALAYLVTGSPLSQVSSAESNMLASAALSYGAGKADWLADKLGIDEFNVEEGGTLKDTLLTMGQYLTPDFYLGTRVGMFNKQASLVLKHKLTDRINVETQTGTSQRIKLNYEFDRN